MSTYKQRQIQEARLKIKKNLRWAGVCFILSLAYTILGWQVMMGFYGSFFTVMVLVWLILPVIPFGFYVLIGFVFWALTWQFIENAANAKIELNNLLWEPPV